MTDGPVLFSARVGGPDLAGLAAQAVNCEESGFDQVWSGNDLFGGPGIVAWTMMLAATSRIKVGSGVIDPVSIHPAQIAQLASGLQEMSGDRFLLGVGAGSDVFFSWAGLTPAKPAVRTREAIIAIRELTNGRSPAGVPGAGAGWTPLARIKSPRPVPIYVGGMGPRMLNVTGKYADGALALCLPPEHVFSVVKQVSAGAVAAGRNPDEVDVAACLWCSISDDRAAARRLLAAHIAKYSGSLSVDALRANGLDPEEFDRTQQLMLAERTEEAIDSVTESMLRLGVVGGADEVIEQCAKLIEAGVRHISFGPPMGTNPPEAVRLLGTKVLPVLRKMFN